MARRPKPLDVSTARGHPAYNLGLTSGSYKAYKQGRVPLALAERSPGGIQRAAQSMTKQAYAPVNAALNSQAQRLKDLQVKREADNAAFANWVQSRGDQLQAEAIGQANATRDRLVQGQQEFGTQLQAIHDSANANIQRQAPGANPIGGADAAQLAAHEAAGQASTLAATNAAQAKVGTGMDATMASLANNHAVVAAQKAKDFADLLDKFSALGDQRTKVALQQGSDAARNVQNLLNQEVTKAQAIIAGQQFGAKLTADTQNKRATRQVTRRGQDVTRGNNIRTTDTSRQNTKDRLAADAKKVNKYGIANDKWQRMSTSHRQRVIKNFDQKTVANSPAGKKAKAKAQQDLSSVINVAKGVIAAPDKSGAKPPSVGPGGNVTTLARWLISQGANEALANMAAWAVGHPGKPQPKANQKQFDKYVQSITGSR